MDKEKLIQNLEQIKKLTEECLLVLLAKDKPEIVKGKIKQPASLSGVEIIKKPIGKKKVKDIHKELLDNIKNIRIDDQKYPLVKNNDDVLIKCLFILDIVKNEANLEELTAPQIEIAAPFFNKLKVSHQAARGTLDRHPEYVSIRREGPKKTFYSIKDKGIKYYKNPEQEKEK